MVIESTAGINDTVDDGDGHDEDDDIKASVPYPELHAMKQSLTDQEFDARINTKSLVIK